MVKFFSSPKSLADVSTATNTVPRLPVKIEVGLLTGGQDRHYAFGLAMALVSRGVCLDVIGSDEVDGPELHATPNLRFLNLRGNQKREVNVGRKISRVVIYYAKLIHYASIAKPAIFHILWNNKVEFFDRTLLMLYYKLLRKKIVLTAHNVNAGKRDSTDSMLNRFTLRMQYRLADHIFVHTEQMKRELLGEFGIDERAITVIPYGINNAVPNTDLTPHEAKRKLGIRNDEKTILFFGRIVPYKGLELLAAAFQRIAAMSADYRLIIAGARKRSAEKYLDDIQQTLSLSVESRIIQRLKHIPDEETELYFKAADLLVLPYTQIYQSGILFLGYSFGLPVVATDVGSLKEDIIDGRTGFLCKPGDAVELAATIVKYFESDLFRGLSDRRQEIRNYFNTRHSWNLAGEMTRSVYVGLLGKPRLDPS